MVDSIKIPKKKKETEIVPKSPIEQFQKPLTPQQPKVNQGAMSPAPTPQKDFTPKIIRDKDSGKINGVELPDGRVLTGLSPTQVSAAVAAYNRSRTAPAGSTFADQPGLTKEDLIRQQIADEQLKKQIEQQMTPPNASPELLQQVGQPNIPQETPTLPGQVNLAQAGKTAIQKGTLAGLAAGTSAAGVALGVTAATGGAAAPSIPLAAAFAGGGAFIYVAGQEFFKSYDQKDEYNYKYVSDNFRTAQENMYDAISLANKGAGDVANYRAVNEFNEAIAQINIAERQLKELSTQNQNKYISDIRLKQNELESFKRNIPDLQIRMRAALQRPTKDYIQNGVMQ